MLVQLQARTAQGLLLNLPLEDASSGYAVRNIDGLDPVKANLVSSSFATFDGEQYQSSRREARNIKIRLGLSPIMTGDTARSLRKNLYTFFLPKSEVSLRFILLDGLTVDIKGRVESFESALFTQDPVVDISIMCYDPDFFVAVPVIEAGYTTSTETEQLMTYAGEIETGIVFRLYVDRPLTEFTIYHRPPDGTIRTLDFAESLLAGDTLEISTIPGSKYATLIRAESPSSILRGLSPYSNWLEFMPGSNYVRVYALGDPMPFDIRYTKKYGGL